MHQHSRGQLSLAALACLCAILVNCAATRAADGKEAPAVAKILQSERDDASLVAEKSDAEKDAEAPKEFAPKNEVDNKQPVASSALKPTEPSEAAAPAAASQQTTSQEVSTNLKDLKSLLENKNDAENDLGPSPIASGAPLAGPKAEQAPPVIKTQFASEPSVDADKPLDDRFHYSIGAEKPLEGKKEEPARAEEKPKVEESAKPVAASPADEEPEEAAKKGAGETEEEEKESESEPSSSSTKAPEASTTTTTEAPSSTASTEKPVVVVTELEEDKRSTTTTMATTALPPVDNTEKPAAKDSELAPSDKTPSAAPTEAANSQPSNKDSNALSTTPSTTTTANEASSSATTTTSSPSSTPLTAKSDAQEKPSVANSVSSIATAAAAAAGSSLGSAVGSAIGSRIGGKEKPSDTKPVAGAPVPLPSSTSPAPSSTSSSSTTRAPASRRKSTTDRWNRWQPSTSEAPPVRRRPVLPSIRRRFRPYNRFSPFPWAPSGPEVYSPGQPYETPLGADAEPDFGRPPPFEKSTRPPRRRSTTELPAWKPSTTRPKASASESGDEDEPTPSVSTRRQQGESSASGPGRRQPGSTNRFPENDWSQPGGRMPDPFESFHPSEPERHRPPHRRHNKHHHRQRHDERPYLSEPSLFNPARPQSPGFGLFNSAGSSSTGSGFDILNPFSWVDEITKPLRPSHHHNRPGFDSGRPGGPQSGRPSGPVPVEGEYNSGRPGPFEGGVAEHPQRPGHHEHEHHHDHHHRPHRPVGSGGRDDYYDDHHHDCHHEHEHEHDHHHDHSRPHRPIRPDGYEDYGSGSPGRRPLGGGGLRPERPYYNRRDQPTSTPGSSTSEQGDTGSSGPGSASGSHSSSGSSNSGDSTIVRENETLNSGAERHANRGSERQVGGSPSLRRVPMFSPFDSLFGTLDDELFGGLRSSFVDAPMKASSGEVVPRFDAIVNSPKISLPAAPADAPQAEQSDRKPGVQSAALISRSISSGESVAKVAEERVQPVEKSERRAKSEDSPAEINRAGIRHFLLMI